MQMKLILIIFMVSFSILTCAIASNANTIHFNNPIKDDLNAHVYIMKGINFYKDGNYEEAIKSYNRAIVLAPDTEIAETGWAGKELIFYRQGKNEEALVCYLKLMDIDRKTNLIEKSKIELMHSVSGSTSASWLGLSFTDLKNKVLQIENKTGILGSVIIPAVSGISAGIITKEVVTISASAAPEIVFPAALIVFTACEAYTHRDQIKSVINSTINTYGFNDTFSSILIGSNQGIF